jgi:phage RecT family recombinase
MAETGVSTERQYTRLEVAVYALPKTLTKILGTRELAEAFVVEVLNMGRKTPGLHQCSVESLQYAVVRMARLGLNPSIPNEVWLIPRKGQAELQYGYGGLRKLVLRSPEVLDCFARDVRVNDEYHSPETPVSLPIHRLPERFAPRGRVEGYYAVALVRGGNWRTVQMSVAEVEAHRERYSQRDSRTGQWGQSWSQAHADLEGLTNFDKMGLKTVLRMLCNARDLTLSADVVEVLREEALPVVDAPVIVPALTQRTAPTVEELMHDLAGDAEQVAVRVEREVRPVREQAKAAAQSGPEWDTLRAHQDDARLPETLLEAVQHALQDALTTASEAHTLADQVLAVLDGQEG